MFFANLSAAETPHVGVSGVHFARNTIPIPPNLDTVLHIATRMRERRLGRTDTSFDSTLVMLGNDHSIAITADGRLNGVGKSNV